MMNANADVVFLNFNGLNFVFLAVLLLVEVCYVFIL